MIIPSLERIDPVHTPWIYRGTIQQHLQRYYFVKNKVIGQSVLDCACGTGYGSQILAQVATAVTGIDISPEAITTAKDQYQQQNTTYICADAARIPLPDKSFDCITSFETIEHLPVENVELYLGELKRLLKAGGTAYISSPDINGFSLNTRSNNHFHVQEFTTNEFVKLINRHFTINAIYAQELTPTLLINAFHQIAVHTNISYTQKIWRAARTLINCSGKLIPYDQSNTKITPYITVIEAHI